ncbi:MAG: serine protein kinase RIO [Nanoarchaeota archaeon]
MNNLEKLSARHLFDELDSSISIGKEANIFSATKGKEEIIVKIYRVLSCNFNKMYDYLKRDTRVTGIKKQRSKIIYAWTKREYRNLLKARNLGINVPTPIEVLDNIILLEYIGDQNKPAPQLKDIDLKKLGKKRALQLFKKIKEYMRKMHLGGLVHGDLSSFNILYHKENPVFIDFSQSTTSGNGQYMELLERDIKNIVHFFNKYDMGIDEDSFKEEIIRKKEK